MGWLVVEVLCSSVLLFEALAKLRVWGGALRGPYWSSWRNRIDFILMAAPLAAQLRCAFLGAVGDAAIEAARLALSLRMLRLTRVFTAVRRFRVIWLSLMRLLPSAASIFGVLGVTMILFAQAGLDLFGGLLYDGNTALERTDYAAKRMYAVNFNDFPSALVTLWCLLIVNDWWVIMAAVSKVWGRSAPVYFIAYYMICPIVLFSVLTSFVLQAFMAQVRSASARSPGACTSNVQSRTCTRF